MAEGLVTAAESVVEADYALDFTIAVRDFVELGLEEILLSSEHLEVVSKTVLHQ